MRRTTVRRAVLSVLVGAGMTLGAAAPALASPADEEEGHSHSHEEEGESHSDDGGGESHSHDDEEGHSHDEAPSGGVDAGFGGTSGGIEVMLPLTLAGGAALAAGGVAFVRRRATN